MDFPVRSGSHISRREVQASMEKGEREANPTAYSAVCCLRNSEV